MRRSRSTFTSFRAQKSRVDVENRPFPSFRRPWPTRYSDSLENVIGRFLWCRCSLSFPAASAPRDLTDEQFGSHRLACGEEPRRSLLRPPPFEDVIVGLATRAVSQLAIRMAAPPVPAMSMPTSVVRRPNISSTSPVMALAVVSITRIHISRIVAMSESHVHAGETEVHGEMRIGQCR